MMRRWLLAAALVLSGCGEPVASVRPTEETGLPCGIPEAELGRFVGVPSGQFLKAAYAVYPEEAPEIILHVEGFDMLAHEVTNAEFARFVEATGHETAAEGSVREGQANAGSAVFVMPEATVRAAGGWSLIPGATWRTPEGPGSDIEGRESQPVVHVTLADAEAYAAWAGGRLPTEEEWEYAAAIGLPDPADPQSGAYGAGAAPRANTWQGLFPFSIETADGFVRRAPAGCYPPSEVGLYDMMGNVWEWTATPYGATTQTIKGGSYLCADNFCRRYRPAARQPQEAGFSASHIGFRIVRDRPEAPSATAQ